MKQKLLLIISFVLLLTVTALAQNKLIKGTVTDATTNAPLSGVSITVPGTTTGTTTDNAGQFFLQVPGATKSIQISIVNYQAQTIDASGDAPLLILLTAEIKGLDEVVVVGYGTQKKKDLTGSVSTIGSKDV